MVCIVEAAGEPRKIGRLEVYHITFSIINHRKPPRRCRIRQRKTDSATQLCSQDADGNDFLHCCDAPRQVLEIR